MRVQPSDNFSSSGLYSKVQSDWNSSRGIIDHPDGYVGTLAPKLINDSTSAIFRSAIDNDDFISLWVVLIGEVVEGFSYEALLIQTRNHD